MRENILEKFYSQVKENRWTGSKNLKGYGVFYLGKDKHIGAHVFSFILHNKRMPREDVHHTCGDASCVDPLHLEEKSRSEHILLHKRKEFCLAGHKFTIVGRTRSGCKKCNIIKMQEYRKKYRRIKVGGKYIHVKKEKEINHESTSISANIKKNARKLDNGLCRSSKQDERIAGSV